MASQNALPGNLKAKSSTVRSADPSATEKIWIEGKIKTAGEELSRQDDALSKEKIILELGQEFKAKSTPDNGSDEAVRKANFFVPYSVALNPLVNDAKNHMLNLDNCEDLRRRIQLNEPKAQMEKNGSVEYSEPSLKILKIVDSLCTRKEK